MREGDFFYPQIYPRADINALISTSFADGISISFHNL
jgi:hypothetical protein